MKDKLLTSFLFAAVFLALGSTALATTTWYVNGVSGSDSNSCLSPTTACKTIGHAISLAASGDSIRVAPATYTENLTIGFSLTIAGSGARTTIIDGGGAGRVVTISSATAHVNISGVTIRNGFSHISGAGIANGGTLKIINAAVIGNRFAVTCLIKPCNGVGGGGILNGNGATLTIRNSTVAGNSATGRGGGIYNLATAIISNSTLSGNSSGAGGAIANGFSVTSGTAIISNSTISSNTAHFIGGGIFNSPGSTVALQNSIVANNTGGNCGGTMTSHGYNLSSDTTCNFTGTGDLNNTDPMLGPLQNNGGPTQTMALPSGSPAVDAGNPSGCTDGLGHLLKTDQRGKPRPDTEDTGGCDMGAYERQSD